MNRFLFWQLGVILLVVGCTNSTHTYHSTKSEPLGVSAPGSADIYYNSLFGEKYLVQGGFLDRLKDSIETSLWTYTSLKSPFVFFGNYSHGLQKGNWNFIMSDGMQLSSQWDIYDNGVTPCAFSIPFQCETQYADSLSLKLRTMNDSLGKIGIMVQIRDTALDEEDLRRFGSKADKELNDQGFRFTNSKREISNGSNKYFFYEYSLRDSLERESKAFYFYGNVPSQKHFVLFTFYHQGHKVDLVQTFCSMMATSLYVDNERFYNPYSSGESK